MKLQTLTVIFIIIMLPITMVVSQYIKTEISTITLQSEYDTKLNNATYDAIKAFQMNESNSTTENIPTEKIRDVNASVNSFYNSIATSMGVSGYTEEDLKGYIPCLVYTLYDGYYIYTSYDNNGTKEYGLKPYVYYTESITGTNSNGKKVDVTVSYTLDSYIMVVGNIGSDFVSKSGYLYNSNNNQFVNLSENLEENIKNRDYIYKYKYLKTGDQVIKYYKYPSTAYGNTISKKWFEYSTTGDLQEVTNQSILSQLGSSTEDTSASTYIEESKKFTNWVNENLGTIKDYLKITEQNDPDMGTSIFNEHRRQVIKESITTNLQATLTNYKGNIDEFKMPELDETEWDKIINNVSLISFMQGLPLQNKYYRGYSVVTNTQSREFVNPNEIYLIKAGIGNTGLQYHRITCKLASRKDYYAKGGTYRNTSFKRKKYTETDSHTQLQVEKYYYPHKQATACYECIVTSSNTYDTIEEAITGKDKDGNNLKEGAIGLAPKKNYLTALYRERYANYKSLNFGI